MNDTNKMFLSAKDVAEIMGCSIRTAYVTVKKLNDELQAQDYIVVAGKVSRKYFMERCNIC